MCKKGCALHLWHYLCLGKCTMCLKKPMKKAMQCIFFYKDTVQWLAIPIGLLLSPVLVCSYLGLILPQQVSTSPDPLPSHSDPHTCACNTAEHQHNICSACRHNAIVPPLLLPTHASSTMSLMLMHDKTPVAQQQRHLHCVSSGGTFGPMEPP